MPDRPVYNYLVIPVGLFVYRILSIFNSKARLAFQRRNNLLNDLDRKVSRLGPGRRILVHISSVGEYLQARPVLRLLRQNNQETKVILSFYSPSLEPTLGKGVEAEFATYLPFDRIADMKNFLTILQPAMIIFSCYDLWPNLIALARERGIKIALVNANLAENSGKLNPLVRGWFAKTYSELDLILAASDEDRKMIADLGVSGKIITTGNTRFDETIARINAIPENDPVVGALLRWRNQTGNTPRGLCFVVGSSWPEDEAMLLPALGKIWAAGKALQLVIAPHEPTPGHVDPLLQKLAELGANPLLFSEIESGKKPAGPANRAVIIDSVGKLYKLYKLADMAFVGGSFRKEVHNVMEPAGFGIPVFFGPKIKNSLEALKLAERKGGFVVQNAAQLYEGLAGFIDDGPKRLEAGKQAYELVRENMGAGERTYQVLAENFPQLLNAGKKN